MFKNERELANLNECCVEQIVTLGVKHKKDYILSNIIPQSLSQYHNKRSFRIHDLEIYDKTYNCIGISAKDLIGDVKIPLSHALRKLYREINGGYLELEYNCSRGSMVPSCSSDQWPTT